ncbi:hypothetical protein [Corynebacterium glyciniphilum]|uniref:hypothetical protein n=2 Tax=Corynebacterium glyciniphilum TaxID=1404244 RepID=UPI0011AB59AA|nr:hypothetical protein [Corynebacterium glyciniphilum]MDN5683066.1 hypothetical protein [Corynebacterium glyciniphilum]
MVHQDSVVGDDGSHRLLVVPCALVVLVLVLMVTACSSVGERAGAGESSGEEEWPTAAAAAPPVGEGVDEPVVTEDGRMIQPTGHTGLWFETEPADPLEKLVYESQRFVGHPVALEPIGERALLPQWEDMPDPCHPEVIRRMEELGVDIFEDDDVSYGYAQCAGFKLSIKPSSNISFEWGVTGDIVGYSMVEDWNKGQDLDSGFIDFGERAEELGCISYESSIGDKYFAFSVVSPLSYINGCSSSNSTKNIFKNAVGGVLF